MAEYTRTGRILTASSEKPHIFLAPIYAWRYPRPIEELIRQAELIGKRTAGKPRYVCPDYKTFMKEAESVE